MNFNLVQGQTDFNTKKHSAVLHDVQKCISFVDSYRNMVYGHLYIQMVS